MQQLAEMGTFEHVTMSSYHPQANGKAEQHVALSKLLLKKNMKAEKGVHGCSIWLRFS
eukprot:CAMPEP_0177634700 /NCGR_PEP_ID=MMETSP0447-20121125/3505_1 /TAXON_ID=0 /ORGANISM="Stygamoeba regulata, Strain BSH-02190019" /LENGTH=57 /DNA_ID=CAMNT_0019136433 /DNA_START=464 /DNA_END=637 /DNA_ORIENTATION=+